MVNFQGSKNAFWQALIFTIAVFFVGLVFGYFLESYKADKSEMISLEAEINLLDDQVRVEVLQKSNLSCEAATESVFSFADKIYEDALLLERYGAAANFNAENLKIIHRRYDLLRVLLWEEGMGLKSRCKDIHTVVYLFEYSSEDVETSARQNYFSKILLDLKNNNPNEILLIPIAANLDLASVELIMKSRGINSPSILIDEEKKVNDVITYEDLEKLVFGE